MSGWISYNDLAWTEPILARPEDFVGEVSAFCEVIKKYAQRDVKDVLHLACGAGVYDFTFKKHFSVTGLDISPGMLKIGEELNPEVSYHQGDMRSFELNRKFDAVIVPDAIGYLTTPADLKAALDSAFAHLKSGGVFLATVHTREEFRENNFAYSNSDGDYHITVFENNHITDDEKSGYEATIIYLIRSKDKLDIFTDVHKLGLFEEKTWVDLLTGYDAGVNQVRMDNLYESFLLGEGEYPLTVFVCVKK